MPLGGTDDEIIFMLIHFIRCHQCTSILAASLRITYTELHFFVSWTNEGFTTNCEVDILNLRFSVWRLLICTCLKYSKLTFNGHIFIYSKIRDMMISITISGFTKRLFFSEISVMFGQYSRGLLVPFRALKKWRSLWRHKKCWTHN